LILSDVLIRLILGLVIGIGTVFAMNFLEITVELFGLLFILVGINVILYAPVMKSTQFYYIRKELIP